MPDLSKEFCSLPPFEREDVIFSQSKAAHLGWQIEAFDLPSIWKETCGKDVTVAVLDSGADLNHPDLHSNLIPGYNVINPKLPPQDDNGHGSHVCGIIGALHDEDGIVGVANCCKIMPIKVLDRFGAGRMDHVVEGIKIAVEKGADLICMSLGTRNALDPVYKAIENAAKAGVICFVAAGNAGQTTQLLYPAAYDITMSIGAIDENCMRASFSCTGPNLDFVAPGVNILSTVPMSSYAIMSGTSQAAPFACGIAALILSHRRQDNPGLKLSKADYVTAMSDNALSVKNLDEKYAQLGSRFFQGLGIINPARFTEWVEQKKVEMVAQSLGNAMGDLGMLKTTTDVAALRKLNAQLTKQLKEFPKATAQAQKKRAARKPSSAVSRRG